MNELTIQRLDVLSEAQIHDLCDVLIDCVEGGASVNFLWPMTRAKAEAFWRGVAAGLARADRALLVARDSLGSIVGTAQAVWAPQENQPHRADVAKMLVHRRARRLGAGAALLRAAEAAARAAGKTLLVLDTASDAAERLYEREGWRRVGRIPNYALMPDGASCATVVFYKELAS
jgi:GNAT superfamily N-acetyltransferase